MSLKLFNPHDSQLLAARKRIKMANKSDAELELAKEQDALGPTGKIPHKGILYYRACMRVIRIIVLSNSMFAIFFF